MTEDQYELAKKRYTLEFRLIPETFHDHGEKFIENCLQYREEYMAHLYNYYFQNICKDHNIRYSARDFHISENRMSSKERILYLELPQPFKAPTVFCTAYAVAYRTSIFGGIKNARFFTVECSGFGTTCIGSMDAKGNHSNYGEAYPNREDNIKVIYRLYK